ncbi:NUDIX hydrolase [Yoonia vestfoldensis]|uniref:NUDIX hydrolase n=1 Tax=Yoonia vestfoldensis TaxID=245188 RepID=UPI00038260FD|nr:NUDIX hydrolase [Yoonia vestfoldensis]
MTPVRDAATIIMLRDADTRPAVLMGQRGASVAFMPGKFVFPGGAVDPNDGCIPVPDLSPLDHARLQADSSRAPDCLAAAAIRELWEETGQVLGTAAPWPDPPQGWRGFAATGHRPNGAALQFFFRAVTPVGPPRRFDARFFLADAADLVTDPDDFTGAEDELANLQWVALDRARGFDLPFITQVVLAELAGYIARGGDLPDVPFFRNDDEAHLVSRLGGRSPL